MQTAERLIVAADFDPRGSSGIEGVRSELASLTRDLADTGVMIKVNSLLRCEGYGLIRHLHGLGLRVFADLKLTDIKNTMETDAAFLAPFAPELVTVMTDAGLAGMQAVALALPSTEVLGVTVLTSLDDHECRALHGAPVHRTVGKRIGQAKLAGLGGIVCAASDLTGVHGTTARELGLTRNTPGIRPEWASVEGDDQQRVMTISGAFAAGATRVILGRPIMRAANRREAVLRTLAEIEAAVGEGG